VNKIDYLLLRRAENAIYTELAVLDVLERCFNTKDMWPNIEAHRRALKDELKELQGTKGKDLERKFL